MTAAEPVRWEWIGSYTRVFSGEVGEYHGCRMISMKAKPLSKKALHRRKRREMLQMVRELRRGQYSTQYWLDL